MSTEAPQPAARPRAPVIRLDNYGENPNQRMLKRQVPAWFISLLFHAPFALILILNWLGAFDMFGTKKAAAETIDTAIQTTVEEEEAKKDFENPDIGTDVNLPTNYNIERIEDVSVPGLLKPDEPPGNQGMNETPVTVPPPPGINTGGQGGGFESAIAGNAAMGAPGGMNGVSGYGFRGASGATRQRMLTEGGGNTVSEACVVRGLLWLQKVQKTNGSWEIDGNHKSNIAGTGIALLPFLAAGQTHKGGNKELGNSKYMKNVDNGLKFLVTKQKADGSFVLGNNQTAGMYDQAIATMALCEAFGMTNDPKLRGPAQLATNYIVKAQHSAGGWRYGPGQAGDTSVTGWQIQALKSALLAGLSVEKTVAPRASQFLDSVAGGQGSRKGSTYGYTDGNGSSAMSAVGLLCRQYLGWGPKNPKLAAGIDELKKLPPRKDKADPQMFDIYYYYYATQVMHFFGGPEWHENWNPKMRDWLIDLQVKGNPQNEGSWNPDGGHTGGAGGRLTTSCLALLTLEVYYRHLPLYKRESGMKELEN